MSTTVMTGERPVTVEALRLRWGSFLVLGLVLVACGVAALMLPRISTIAAGTVLGAVLIVAGAVKIVQTLKVAGWSGYLWQMMGGAVEVVGGILIYLHPLKGAVAITLLIAVVFLVQGFAQIGLGLKVRPQEGWGWLIASGAIAFAISLFLAFKLPLTRELEAGTIAGISILVAGLAYVGIAYAVRKSGR